MNTIVVTSTKQNIKFGYEGEDNVTKIIFPYDESWLEYGEGNFEVRILRCGDEVAYTATEVVDDRQAMTLTMTVTDIELSVRGRGEMQLCYVCPDSIKKSPIYQYTVNRSVDYKYAVDPPEGSIIASVEKSLSEIKNTTNRLSNSVISIESSINDVNSQIDNINNKISEFDEEIDSVGEVETKVDNLETSIESINGRINTAEGNINENTESISDLNESVTELENRKVTDLETSGGKSDSGKYLTVGTDGKIKATSLTIPPTITVDESLSTTSKNPVQNKVIKTELNNINSNIETCNTEISKINGSLDTLGTLTNVIPTDTASGSIASFSDGADNVPVKSLTVKIDPVQSGTGDPSPDNIRPISGWTGTTLTCNNDIINIDWTDEAGTVYGGTLDVTNGKLTVDMAMVDLGTLKWYYFTRTNPPHFGTDVSGMKSQTNNLLCSNYATVKNYPYTNAYGTIRATPEHSSNGIKISDAAYTDTNAFTAAMSGVQLVYELANPITYQLTPQEVKTVLGENNIFADTGDVSVEYRADIKKYIGSLGDVRADLADVQSESIREFVTGHFIKANGVESSTVDNYACTDYVPCSEKSIIRMSDIYVGESAYAYTFYDSAKTRLSGQNSISGDISVTVPANAKYVRFSSRITSETPVVAVYNGKMLEGDVENIKQDYTGLSAEVSQLQADISDLDSAITPEDTTFFDIYDFIEPSFVKYVSGMVGTDGKFQDRGNFELTSIEIKVEPNTTYVLEIPGATRNLGTSNDTGIFEGNTAYNTLTITKNGDYLVFTTGSDVSYALIYFYNGTYDMSRGIEGIHLYKDNVKTSTTPTVKMENLPASVKGNAEPLNILIFGDSITDTINFTIDSETDTTTAYSVKIPNNSYANGQGQIIQYEMWPTLIQRVLNVAELRNYAKSGAHFYTSSNALADPRQKLLYQVEVAFNDLTNPNGVFPSNDFEPDIIIIACGINDANIASGSFETTMAKTVMNQAGTGVDVEATMNAMNQQVPMDAMRYVLMKIKRRFPTALLLYVNPLQQTYGTNDARLTSREELRKMAEQYDFINLDGFAQFGVVRDFETQNEVGLLTKDGLHPNDKGQKLYARNIVQAIKRYYFPLDSFNP